jgi:hypothetical protein
MVKKSDTIWLTSPTDDFIIEKYGSGYKPEPAEKNSTISDYTD